jgi:hypothetical protein
VTADLTPAGDPTWERRALDALSAFRPRNRLEAAVVLGMWRHADRLTPDQHVAVVDRVTTS